jgi:tetratricopeptide (TPR) repeat protein
MSFANQSAAILGWCLATRLRLLLCLLFLVSFTWLGWTVLEKAQVHRYQALAETALASFDFKEALEDIQSAISWQPRNPALWLLASQAARREGNVDEAAIFLKEYRRLVGSTPDGRLEGALQAVQQGEIEAYVNDLLPKVDSGHPAAEQILEALTVGAVGVYRFDQASFWIHHLLEKFPRNPIGLLTKARMDDVINKKERALETCRKLLDEYPRNYGARLLQAGLTKGAQRYSEAVGLYEDMLKDYPGDLKVQLGLVKTLVLLGENEKAESVANTMTGVHPESGEAWMEASRLAQGNGKMEEAASMLKRAAELSPYDHEIHYQLGICLERLGKKEEAQKHLDRFRQIEGDMNRLDALLKEVVNQPKDPKPRVEAGQICLRNGQPDESLRWLHGALEISPNDPATHAALTNFYEAMGDENLANFHRQKTR